jgi:hypothetical protein
MFPPVRRDSYWDWQWPALNQSCLTRCRFNHSPSLSARSHCASSWFWKKKKSIRLDSLSSKRAGCPLFALTMMRAHTKCLSVLRPLRNVVGQNDRKCLTRFFIGNPPSCAVIILVGNMSNGCRQIYSIRTADSFGLLILSSSLSLSLYTVLAKCYFAAAVLYSAKR